MRLSLPPYALIMFALTMSATDALGQTRITLLPDGRLVEVTRATAPGREVTFVLRNADQKYAYFISWLPLGENSSSNAIYPGGELEQFDTAKKNSVRSATVPAVKMNYQIYRVESAYLPAPASRTLQSLKTEITSKQQRHLNSERQTFRKYLDSLTYPAAQRTFDKFSSFLRIGTEINRIEKDLAKVKSSSDSLSEEDLIAYRTLLQKKRTLMTTLEGLIELMKGATRVSDSFQELIVSADSTRIQLIDIQDSLHAYDIMKLSYKSRMIELLEAKKKARKDMLEALEQDSTFRDFIGRYRKLNKTFDAKIEMIHAGKVLQDNEVQWVDYDLHLNTGNNVVSVSRLTAKLPVLSEFDFLGVQLVNVPIEKTKSGLPVEIAIDKTENVFPVDRFGGIRSESDQSVTDQVTKLWGSGMEKANPPDDEPPPTDCELKGTILSNLANQRKTCKSLTLGGVTVPLDQVDKVLKNYSTLLTVIDDRKVVPTEVSMDKAFVDMMVVHGARFNYGTAPTVTLKTIGPTAADNKVLLADEFEAIQKLHWFGLSTGIIVTGIHNYSYSPKFIEGGNRQQLVERSYMDYSVQPVLLLSFFPKPHRLDKKPDWALSFNAGVSYIKPLDNLYFGLGLEPLKHVQLNIGGRIGNIERLDLDQYNPYTLDYKDHLEEHWRFGWYAGVNFYMGAISEFVRTIFP